MELFNSLILLETQKEAHKQILYAIRSINQAYNEWNKRVKNRRKNAVNLNTFSVNKIATIPPNALDYVNDEIKQKISIIIMRCISLPCWDSINKKKLTYKKLYPYIKKLEMINPNTGTKGTLREIIMTRLSAPICVQSDFPEVFVAYEPLLPDEYLKFLFGDEKFPEKTYRMETLPLPEDYDDLIDIIKINHEKAVALRDKQKRLRKNNV